MCQRDNVTTADVSLSLIIGLDERWNLLVHECRQAKMVLRVKLYMPIGTLWGEVMQKLVLGDHSLAYVRDLNAVWRF